VAGDCRPVEAGGGVGKTPNTKIQTPNDLQTSNLKPETPVGVFVSGERHFDF
jgi:hypothetical protein